MSDALALPRRHVIIVCIMILIAIAHILGPGSYLPPEFRDLYYSYFSDLVLPFGCYFLLGLADREMPFLRHAAARWAMAILIPSLAETCQYFGIPALGTTFDLLDYLMYGLGATFAFIVDTLVFSRMFDFWNTVNN